MLPLEQAIEGTIDYRAVTIEQAFNRHHRAVLLLRCKSEMVNITTM